MSYVVEMVKACQICQARLSADRRKIYEKVLEIRDDCVLLSKSFDEHTFSHGEEVELEKNGFYLEIFEGVYRWVFRK